ncbi:hypothetical protein [Holdemanella porci]|uniref:hypothetical protein n=1 Tax=Holdemanella porci TaxID=2652276 RepID=UPI00388F97DC
MHKTAQEMFKTLGYADNYDSPVEIVYSKYDDNGEKCKSIKFLKLEGMEGVIAVDENSQPKKITIDELEAIYKQCVELAWV